MFRSQTSWTKERVVIDHYCFECLGTTAKERHITVNGIPFISPQELVNNYPELLKNLSGLAILVNFLAVGEHFSVLADEDALNALKCKKDPEQNPQENAYGYFDISGVHPPKIDGKFFIFFAINETNEILYKATFHYPFAGRLLGTRYQLLPR